MVGIRVMPNSDMTKYKKLVESDPNLHRPLLIDIIKPNHGEVRLKKLKVRDFLEPK